MKYSKHLSQNETLKILRLHNIFKFNDPDFLVGASNTTGELDSSEGFDD